MAIICAIAAIASFEVMHESEHSRTDMMAHSASESCASLFELIAESDTELQPGTPEYQHYRELLRSICKDSDMEYLYAYECDLENQTVTYLMCVASDEEEDERVARERSYGTVVSTDFSDVELSVLRGEEIYQALELDNEFGHTLEWFSLVNGWDGNVLAGASYSVTEQRTRVTQSTLKIILPIILALMALLIVQLMILRKRIFEPLRSITNRMRSFSAEEASDFKPIGINTNDEMGRIAEAFEGMASDIGAYVSDIERMTAERVQADVELDVARRIQLGIVPAHTQLQKPGCTVYGFSRAAHAVGGDFYDCFELEDGRIAAFIGDASGKGVAAALLMAVVKTIIHDGLIAGETPATILNRVNDRLCESNPEEMFVTVLVMAIDPETGVAHFANAGHMPPFLIGDEVRVMETDPGVLLGLFDDVDLQDGTICLEQGESLLLYTDGATEAVNLQDSFLGSAPFAELLRNAQPFATPADLIDAAVRIVDDFSEGREQFDDLTFVALTRNACSMQEVPVRVSSNATIREAILGKRQPDSLKRKACLACEEAFANIVSYSGARHAWFRVEEDAEGICVTLADDGIPFDPIVTPIVETPFEDLDGGGMGMSLIRQLASGLEYHRDADKNVLALTFHMPADS